MLRDTGMAVIQFRSNLRRTPRQSKALSLTPLIDVVFILLLFFMLATNYKHWQAIPVETAIVDSALLASNAESITIELKQSDYFWDGERFTEQDLLVRLQYRLKRQPSLQVTVAPVAQAPVQALVSLFELLRLAGVINMSLAINQPQDS